MATEGARAAGREPPDHRALLAVAEDAARRAGAELLRRYGRTGGVATKTSATDPVSDADRASEHLLADVITAARPADGIIGEEGAERAGRSDIRWVIDPLDGTVNFLYTFPGWCVSVAAEDDHGAVVGVVHDPLRGETFTAVRGRGAWLDGRRLQVNQPQELGQALIATGFSYDVAHRRRQARVAAELLGIVRDIRRAGSAALDLCAVAAGRVDGYYEDSTNHWDWAAGALVAAEAGAVVSRLDGPAGRCGVVAAPPFIHHELRRFLAGGAGPGSPTAGA